MLQQISMATKKEFDDGDGEIEVRLELPEELVGATPSNVIRVECTATSLKVIRTDGQVPLLEASPLYEKVRPSELTWYVDKRQVIITVQKAVSRKWPALTDKEALEKRFGPLNMSPKKSTLQPPPLPPQAASSSASRSTADPEAGKAGEAASPPPKDAAGALEARNRVDRLLRAAQRGDLEDLKLAAMALTDDHTSTAGIPEALQETRDATGRTALHFAAHKGQLAVLLYILGEAGLAPDCRDEAGETPLMLAAREGHLEAATCLLDAGADAAAAAGTTMAGALHHAAAHGSSPLVSLLLSRGCPVDSPSSAGTPLLWACGHGQLAAANRLLAAGADPSAANEDGVNALITAAAAGHTDIVKRLLQAGADVAASAGAGVTPLFIAANEGQLEMVEALLDAGADANAKDEDGSTPIFAAASQGHLAVVARLLPATLPDPSVGPAWTVEAVMARSRPPPPSLHKSPMPPPQISAAEEGAGGGGGSGGSRGSVGPERQLASRHAKERGDAAFRSRDFPAALDAYTQAIDLDPTASALFSNRSLCWVRLGQPEQALEDARAARKLKPDWSKACYREGAALRLMERYEEAATAFFEGVQLDPENLELTTAFGEAIEAGKKAHAKSIREEKNV